MQNTLHFKKSHCGVTLIEMLVAMTILAILLAIGVPNMAELFRPNRLDAATSELVGALNLARSEAIRRGTPVLVEQINAPQGAWDKGWQVTVPGATEPVVRVSGSVEPLTVRTRGALDSLSFDARGQANVPGLFVICDKNALAGSRVVVVSAMGRVRTVRDGGKSSVDDDAKAIASCTDPAAK